MRRAVVLTSGAQILIQTVGLVTGVLASRWLGPGGRGELAAVVSWAAAFTSLGSLGLPVALIYAAAKFPTLRHQLFGNGMIMAAGQWLVLGSVGWWLLPHLLAKHGPTVAHIAVLYLWAYVPVRLASTYANSIQQGAGQYAHYNVVRASIPLTYMALLLLFRLTIGINVGKVAIANILSITFTAVIVAVLVFRRLRASRIDPSEPWFSLRGFRRTLRYGLSAQIGTLQPFGGLQLDVLVLTVLSSTHDLGLYMAALAGANLVRAQGYALGQVVLPEIAKKSEPRGQWRTINRFALLAATGGGLACITVFIFAPELLNLVYGEAFKPAAPILKLLVAAGTINAVYRVVADGLRGMGRPGVSTIAEIVSAGAGAVALMLFVPIWGAIGAAVAVMVAAVVAIGTSVLIVAGTRDPRRYM